MLIKWSWSTCIPFKFKPAHSEFTSALQIQIANSFQTDCHECISSNPSITPLKTRGLIGEEDMCKVWTSCDISNFSGTQLLTLGRVSRNLRTLCTPGRDKQTTQRSERIVAKSVSLPGCHSSAQQKQAGRAKIAKYLTAENKSTEEPLGSCSLSQSKKGSKCVLTSQDLMIICMQSLAW